MSTKLAKIAADFSTQLAAKMLAGATTGTLQSVLDDDGIALANGTYYFTIDGNNSQKEYIQVVITGTAMASIKSVSRQGVITSGTAREHRVGALVELTDFANLRFITALLDGTDDLNAAVPLEYDAAPTLTPGSNQLATVAYADAIAAAGGPDASTTVQGLVEEATEAEINADTATGGTGAKLFAPLDKLATSKYGIRLPSATEKTAITSLANAILPYAADGGASDTYAITLSPVPTGYNAGMSIRFKANTANTGPATINVNSLGAKSLVKSLNLPLETGDIKAGQIVEATYDGTNFQVQMGRSGEKVVIATGSLSGASVTITDIPANYAYLTLEIAGNSADQVREMLVQVDTDNGASFDTTAGNYVGFRVTGTTLTAYDKASLIASATQSAASFGLCSISIFDYQGGSYPKVIGRTVKEDTANYMNYMTYIGSTSAINALKILLDGAGNFDAGTYTLYGIK